MKCVGGNLAVQAGRWCPVDNTRCHLPYGGDCYKRFKKGEPKMEKKAIAVKSPTGMVHAVSSIAGRNGRVHTECGANPTQNWNNPGVDWPSTGEIVKCKRCLMVFGVSSAVSESEGEDIVVSVINPNKFQSISISLTIKDKTTYKALKAGVYDSSKITKLIQEAL